MSNVDLVLAPGAKEGGARFILHSYLKHGIKRGVKYHVFCPFSPDLPKNNSIEYHFISTKGFCSVFFVLFFSYVLVKKYKANRILSFMNYNCALGKAKKTTYFHQSLVFQPFWRRSFKLHLVRFIIKYIDRSDTYIVQTEQVLKSFKESFSKTNVEVFWPGFRPCATSREVDSKKENIFKDRFLAVVPISDARSEYKNISAVIDLAKRFTSLHVIVTSEMPFSGTPCNVNFIGVQSQDDLYALYEQCDFCLFLSSIETLALPIYEFYSTGKPVVVMNAPYVLESTLYKKRAKNLVVLEEGKFHIMFEQFLDNYSKFLNDNIDSQLSSGDWGF